MPHKDPTERAQYAKAWRDVHPEELRAYHDKQATYMRQWSAERKRKGLCVTCERPSRPGRAKCAECGKKQCDRNTRRLHRIKAEAYAAYGGAICACCGETEPQFLQIDHLNGGGRKHAIETGPNIVTWLRKNGYPPGFQILCANCNFGRHLNGGICPHQAKKAAL